MALIGVVMALISGLAVITGNKKEETAIRGEENR